MATAAARIEDEPWYTSSPYEPSRPPVRRLSEIDLLDFDLYRHGDPHSAWRLLREQAPVFWHERGTRGTGDGGFWVLTRYEDIAAVYKDAKTFSSEEGPFLDLEVADTPRRILASIDGPEHRQRRGMIARFFTPQGLSRWEEPVRRSVTAILDDVCETGACDFSVDIAQRLPIAATCEMLGITTEEVLRLSDMLHGLSSDSHEELQLFNAATLEFFADVARERRRTGAREHILDIIANAEQDGEPISEEEITQLLWILFFGGIDSTVHALTGGMLSLFHHPRELAKLRADPAMGSGAVEELLRWTSTSHANKRRATADVEIGGVRVRRGDYVSMWSPSANRDERAYPDPYRFDLDREFSRRFPVATFGGGGPHQCVGQFFARLELRVLFEELMRRMPDIEQAGPAQRSDHFTILLSPIKALPVRFTPGARLG